MRLFCSQTLAQNDKRKKPSKSQPFLEILVPQQYLKICHHSFIIFFKPWKPTQKWKLLKIIRLQKPFNTPQRKTIDPREKKATSNSKNFSEVSKRKNPHFFQPFFLSFLCWWLSPVLCSIPNNPNNPKPNRKEKTYICVFGKIRFHQNTSHRMPNKLYRCATKTRISQTQISGPR